MCFRVDKLLLTLIMRVKIKKKKTIFLIFLKKLCSKKRSCVSTIYFISVEKIVFFFIHRSKSIIIVRFIVLTLEIHSFIPRISVIKYHNSYVTIII